MENGETDSGKRKQKSEKDLPEVFLQQGVGTVSHNTASPVHTHSYIHVHICTQTHLCNNVSITECSRYLELYIFPSYI